MTKQFLKKAGIITILILTLITGMFVLNHPAKNGRKTTEYLPAIPNSPIYVELGENNSLLTNIIMKETMDISGINFLLVNISEEDRGDLQISMIDENQNLLINQNIALNSVIAGKWMTVATEITLEKGKKYILNISATNGNPYFMKVAPPGIEELPFTEEVIQNGKRIDDKISMGINQVTPVELKYGEILYFSVPVLWIIIFSLILFVSLGKEKSLKLFQKIPLAKLIEKYGNELILLLLFVLSCLGIYNEGYIKSVFISADSAGYLREAVNLVEGNGFFYDGLAGYENWFANWPIFYPFLIAGVMICTGTNAYLSSKILSMMLVGFILIVVRIFFKKDAWIYGFCVWNLGFVALSHYTWSELPFILMLLLFVLCFGRIVIAETTSYREYIVLGILGLFCFLIRYFGIYIWIVTAVYIAYYGQQYYKKREKIYLKKATGFTVTALISGMLSLVYLLINKIKNGYASGVSRTLWWDDYEILTNDLIKSLLTEVTNVFGIEIPRFIDAYSYPIKLLLIFTLIGFLSYFIMKHCRWESLEGVFITFGVAYYIIFIAIRYLSSMDSFYFRFFEPASFLIFLGLVGLLIKLIRKKDGIQWMIKKTGMKCLCSFMIILICLSIGNILVNEDLQGENAYYYQLTSEWDEAYKEIPEKSVVIFSDLDFRSSFYRADVIGGEIRPENNFEDLKSKYYGSDYLCIKKEYADVMIKSQEYHSSVVKELEAALKELQDNDEYAIISLRF